MNIIERLEYYGHRLPGMLSSTEAQDLLDRILEDYEIVISTEGAFAARASEVATASTFGGGRAFVAPRGPRA